MPQKLCKLCNHWKSADEFPSNGTHKCLACKRAEYRQTHRKPEVYQADLTTNTKKCRVCKETKDLSEFYRAKESRDGYRPRCKACNELRLPKEVIPSGMKRCPLCTQVLPATLEYFYANKSMSNGLCSHCKKCDFPQKKISNVKPGYKRCPACKEEFPATTVFFYARNQRISGLASHCKSCRRKYDLQHIEDRRGHQRRFRIKNAQELKLRRLANLEHYREYNRKSYRKNARKYREHRKEYRNTHRLQRSLYANKRRVRKRSVGGMITPEQVKHKLKMQHYRCYYAACGHAKFEKKNGRYIYHLEHTIPLSRTEHNPRNDVNYVVLACPSCNLKKHDKLPHEWEQGGRLL